MTTKTTGLVSAFSDYDEPRDYLYALEAPVCTVALPPGLASEAGFDDFDLCFQE